MVLADAAEARRQRILLKRERAKQENNEAATKEECNQPVTTNQNEELNSEIKPKLKTSEKYTTTQTLSNDDEDNEGIESQMNIPNSRDIVANVYRFLEQEYKFMQINNMDLCNVRSLAAIKRRTAAATGLTRDVVKRIVREDRARIEHNRKRRRNQD